MKYNEYNKRDFIQLLSNTDLLDTKLHDAYLELLADKLSKETSLTFSVRNDTITNYGLDISIHSNSIKDYKDLKEQVNVLLKDTKSEDLQLANTFGSYVQNSWTWYYKDKHEWKSSRYSSGMIFEVIHYGLTGTFHNDLKFAHTLEQKYLEDVDWNSPKVYKGTIEELNNIKVQFCKNGNVKLDKTLPTEFWERVNYFYSVVDPKNHRVR